MQLIIAVGLGGAIGSIARYLIYIYFIRYLGVIYPLQTLVVNILGSLLIGVLLELFNTKINIKEEIRVFLVVGFLGGFTTFSAFSADFINFIQRGHLFDGLIYIFISVMLSLFAIFSGVYLVRVLF